MGLLLSDMTAYDSYDHSFEEETAGRIRRTTVYHKTLKFKRGDLLTFNGVPAIFSHISLFEERTTFSRCTATGGVFVVLDGTGLREIKSIDFNAASVKFIAECCDK